MGLKQVALAVDQLLNTLLGGMADETLSARAWRLRNKSKRGYYVRIVIDVIFFLDKDHCKSSYESELLRKHLPKEYSD